MSDQQSPYGFSVIDLETTGLTPHRGDRVVEIAVVRCNPSGQVQDEWTTLVNPGRSVAASEIHGITTTDVQRAPTFRDIVGELTARLAGRAIVAHNAPFDLTFMEHEYARSGWTMPAVPCLCTLDASARYLPYLERRRLDVCCQSIGHQIVGAHTALADAKATAALLAYYLDPQRDPAPLPEHTRLPESAASVGWPSVPRNAVSVVLRTTSPKPTPAAEGTLAALLADLPMSSAIEAGAAQHAVGYLELLAQVLEDGILTEQEARSLAEFAAAYRLTRDEVRAAHRGFLLALARKAVDDGKVTKGEREELLRTAAVLGLEHDLVKMALEEARAATAVDRGTACRPLPAGWAHGEPLRVGQGVAFTGCNELERARLEGAAQAAGLRVTGSVSRKTAVLVTDGRDPNTGKARAARELGTRVVTPEVFAQLLELVQPAPFTRK